MAKRKTRKTIPAYQKRVIDERKQLDDRIKKLTRFMLTTQFMQLSSAEQRRLGRQRDYMDLYSRVLLERIEAFDVR